MRFKRDKDFDKDFFEEFDKWRTGKRNLQFMSEYTGLDRNVIEYLRGLDEKQKRAVSVVIIAIDTILGGKEQ